MLTSLLLCSVFLVNATYGQAQVLPKEASVNLIEDPDDPSLLKISEASDLVFGSKAIGIEAIIFVETNVPKMTITDIRGEAPGWNLTVSLGEFLDVSNNRILKGTKLFYPDVTMTTNGTVNVAERTPETTNTDSSFKAGNVKGLVLDSSSIASPKVLFDASVGQGNGLWSATYNDASQIELLVPAGNLSGEYTATLTYTLGDTPKT